jgi:hypothetical protein
VRFIGRAGFDEAQGVARLPDGRLLIAGSQTSGPTGSPAPLVPARPDAFFAIVGAAGQVRRTKLLDGDDAVIADALAPAPDGSFYASGRAFGTTFEGKTILGGLDGWLARLRY